MAADGRLLVIAYEHPDNPCRSVSNAAEDIARQFAEAAGVDLSRLVWVESYAAEARFNRCTFARDAAGGFCVAMINPEHRDESG